MIGEGFNLPGDVKAWSDWSWFHIKPGKSLRLVILSENPLWYGGHYVGKRMQPCHGQECLECERGTGMQVRWVFAAADILTHRAGLVEVGNSTALELKDYVKQTGYFRGLVIHLGRYSHSKMSRIECDLVQEDIPIWSASMAAPELVKCLHATWARAGFPIPGEKEIESAHRSAEEVRAAQMHSLQEVSSGTRKAG